MKCCIDGRNKSRDGRINNIRYPWICIIINYNLFLKAAKIKQTIVLQLFEDVGHLFTETDGVAL